MASVWRDLRGILGSIFAFGIGGPQIKASGTELQARNAADSDFTDMHVQEIILTPSGSAFKLTVQSAALASDQVVTLPAGGTLPTTTGLHKTVILAFTQASGATFTIDADPPPNGTLIEIRVLTDTAAAGGSPTITIGVTGTLARDMAATDNNLKSVGQYVVEEWLALGATPADIIATMVVSAQTFAGRIALTYVLP